MKQVFTLLVLLFTSAVAVAQLPHVINYQGVARNAQGVALANQPIKVRASLIKDYDGMSITTFFTETRSLTTNQLGLFSFKINDGYGSTTTGNFDNGEWLHDAVKQFLKIELDVNNSGTFVDMGTQQIVSVPYAVFAGRAKTADALTAAPVVFKSVSTQSQTVPVSTTQKISFESLATGSNNFDLAGDEFTAPVTGMYHFDITASASFANPASGYLQMSFVVNGNYMETVNDNFEGVYSKSTQLSLNMHLTAGQKVSVSLFNGGTLSATLGTSGTYFSGHLIR